jgi:hypothetical protein
VSIQKTFRQSPDPVARLNLVPTLAQLEQQDTSLRFAHGIYGLLSSLTRQGGDTLGPGAPPDDLVTIGAQENSHVSGALLVDCQGHDSIGIPEPQRRGSLSGDLPLWRVSRNCRGRRVWAGPKSWQAACPNHV